MTDYAITRHDIDRLREAGACYLPKVGTPLSEIPARDLEWAALHLPDLTEAERDRLHALCGARSWWRDGKLHRDDGPAIEWADGYRAWYRDDKLHRDDGPAVERPNGTRQWWRNGKRLDREDDAA
jgi:hypothetical protein